MLAPIDSPAFKVHRYFFHLFVKAFNFLFMAQLSFFLYYFRYLFMFLLQIFKLILSFVPVKRVKGKDVLFCFFQIIL